MADPLKSFPSCTWKRPGVQAKPGWRGRAFPNTAWERGKISASNLKNRGAGVPPAISVGRGFSACLDPGSQGWVPRVLINRGGLPGHCAPAWGVADGNPASGGAVALFFSHRPRPRQWFEHLFGGPATRALPILREVLKTGPGGYLAFFIPPGRIIDITAVGHLALPHLFRFRHRNLLHTPRFCSSRGN